MEYRIIEVMLQGGERVFRVQFKKYFWWQTQKYYFRSEIEEIPGSVVRDFTSIVDARHALANPHRFSTSPISTTVVEQGVLNNA